jgi:hypothetical protein
VIDLLSATQDAVVAAMRVLMPVSSPAPFLPTVPQDTNPPFHTLGAIAFANEAGKGEGLDRFEVEIQTIYRGTDRAALNRMMFAVRQLEDVVLDTDEVEFSAPRAIGGGTERASDGLTYVGLTHFEIYAQPAA